jgi:hypothetical protein
MEEKQKHVLEVARLRCADIESLLDLYLDRQLIPSLLPKFEEHIQECAPCHSLVHDCQHIVQIAKTLDDPPLPLSIRTRLREVLREKVGYSVPIDLKPRLTVVK